MTALRSDLPALPSRMQKLAIDARGFPVPWFVQWVDGEPKFQIADSEKMAKAVRQKRCWLCGEKTGSYVAFVIGPMCGVNRVSSEPPSHRDCAEFAVKACPFLTRPAATRSNRGLDDLETKRPAGEMIERNPGVTLLWITKSWKPFRAPNGVLFRVGEPTEIHFFREGRKATRDEIEQSVTTGLPILQAMASKEGPLATIELQRQVEIFEQMVERAA